MKWQYRLWSFQGRDIKLERILHKNQHTQRKFLNFENWTSGEPQYIAQCQICIGNPPTSPSDLKEPGTSKLDWGHFEHNKIDRNEL